jgi:ketosteroid isomerase-like protein
MANVVSGQTSNKEIIHRLNQQFLNAPVQKDSAALANILADDFILINPDGKRRTKAANLANLHTPGQSVTSINIDSEELRLFSDKFGIITVWTTNHILSGKESIILKICYMDIYQKRNRKWKAVAAHVTLLR